MSDLDPGVVPVVEAPVEPGPRRPTTTTRTSRHRSTSTLIERDLRDVESTLARLADGTYFTATWHACIGARHRCTRRADRHGPTRVTDV